MYVIEPMKLNRLQARPIVSNRSLRVQFGAQPSKVESQLTAECITEPSPIGARKTQLLALGQAIATKAVEHETGDAEKLNVKPTQL